MERDEAIRYSHPFSVTSVTKAASLDAHNSEMLRVGAPMITTSGQQVAVKMARRELKGIVSRLNQKCDADAILLWQVTIRRKHTRNRNR